MKKLLLIVFLLCITSVLADLQVSDIKLGDENQNRAETTSTSVTITNTGSSAVNDLTVSFLGVNSKYKATGSFSGTIIPVDGSVTLTIQGFVPVELDAVDHRGRVLIHDIGDVVIKGSDGSDITKTVSLSMQAESNLEFGSVKLHIDSTTKTVKDGRDIENLKRGDDIELEIEVQNTFSDSGDCQDESQDCDIDDIEVVIESDRDIDIDDDIAYGSLRAKDEDKDSITFSIPDDVDDGNYDVEMWVTGEDENGALHGERWKFTLEVDVPRDDVRIKSFDLFPDTLSCGETRTSLSVTLENVGRSDQDKVSIFIDSSKLDIKDSIYNIDLEENEETTRSFELTLPNNLAVGQYFIQIIANIDNSEETDRDAARLLIEECVEEPEQEEETPEEDSDINIIEIPPTAGVIYGKEKTPSFFDSNEFILLLAGIFILGLLLLLILLAVLLKK